MDCGKQCNLQAAGTKVYTDVRDLTPTFIGNYILMLIEWMDGYHFYCKQKDSSEHPYLTITFSKKLSSTFALNTSLYYSHESITQQTALPSPYSRIQITVRRASLSITQYSNIKISCGDSPALWSKLPPSTDLSAHVGDPPTSKYRLPPPPIHPPTPIHFTPWAIKISVAHHKPCI